uniref:CobW/HypB/UreG nucleotide-binding domain-containing protein n=1 Tax=Timema tahoe TaxID=61484 RepID=A0A7R9FKY5_9NEOP|nr:unnamed protein product [Timema tahoe]
MSIYTKQLLGSDRVPGLNPSHAEENGLLNEAVRQIALADLVIVNKVDLVSPEHVEQLKKEIRENNAGKFEYEWCERWGVHALFSFTDDDIRTDLILICLPEFLSALPMSDAYDEGRGCFNQHLLRTPISVGDLPVSIGHVLECVCRSSSTELDYPRMKSSKRAILAQKLGQHTRSRCRMYPEKVGGDRTPPLKSSLAVCSVASFSSAIVGVHCVRRLHRHSPAMMTCVFSFSL